MMRLEDVIEILELEPLPFEGGLWKKSCYSDITMPDGTLGYPNDRPLYGAIYYLLTPESFSKMHRLLQDEIWYHHQGPAVRLLLVYPDGKSEVKILGQDLKNGERPQIRVPRGTWQGAAMVPTKPQDPEDETPFTLMSTSMAPEYLATDYSEATFDDLKDFVDPKDLDLLRFVTGDPV